MRISIHLDKEEYGRLAEALLPIIIGTAAEKPDAAVWVKLLSSFKNPMGKASAAALSVLPGDTKDKLLASVINSYSGNIAKKCNQLLIGKGIPLAVEGVSATQGDGIELTVNLGYDKV